MFSVVFSIVFSMVSARHAPAQYVDADVVKVAIAAATRVTRTSAPGMVVVIHPHFALTGDTSSAAISAVREIAAGSSASVKARDDALVCRAAVCHLPDRTILLILGKPRIYGPHAEILVEIWQSVENTRFRGSGAGAAQVRLFFQREGSSWVIRREEIHDRR